MRKKARLFGVRSCAVTMIALLACFAGGCVSGPDILTGNEAIRVIRAGQVSDVDVLALPLPLLFDIFDSVGGDNEALKEKVLQAIFRALEEESDATGVPE